MADFYKQNGSYFTTTGQKILNPAELQNYAKAGGKEVAMPTIPQGATKISDPNYLKTAGLTEKDIFRQGQDIYKLPSVMPSNQIVGEDVPAPIKAVDAYDSTDVTSLMAGTDVTQKGLESQLTNLSQKTPEEINKNKLQDEFATTAGEIKTNKTEAIKQGQKTYDLEGSTKNLQNVNVQLATAKSQYDSLMNQVADLPISSRIIGGTQDRLLRQKAIEVAGLSAVAQAYQGNITLATDTIEKAVNAEYKPQEDYLANLKTQLDFAYDDLTNAEKKKADQLKLVADERLRLLEEEKNDKKEISDIMLQAAQNGADSSTITKIQNSKTVGEAIKNSGQYLKTQTSSTWDTFTDANGNIKLINKFTGEIKNISQSTTNLGTQVGEINGLPSYDTRTANPGVSRSDRNNNPGNIKSTDYSNSFEGVIGVESNKAQDGGNFLIFDSAESGINAIGRLLKEGSSYQGKTAEQAIKKYNGNGSYGASDVGLDPKEDFQSQISDPVKLKEVATKIAQAEGFTGNTQAQPVIPDEVSGLIELVRTGQLTAKEALTEVSKVNKSILSNELSKVDAEKVVSSYTEEMKTRTLQSVDELLGQVNPYTVGFGSLAKGIPTSAARSFSAQLDTLKANIAFGELTAMREASKTGGALGQVSDREGKLLQSALGALDQGQSPEQFKIQLEKIKNSINKWKQEVNNYASESGISTVDLTDLDFKF